MTYPQPPQQQYPPMPVPVQEKFRGLAWAAMILGIVGICGSILPILNNLTAVAAFVGLILGIIAVFGSRKVLAAVGIALCVLGIVVTVVAQGIMLDQFNKTINGAAPAGAAPNPIPAQPAATGTVRYEVSGSGKANTISFGANGSQSQRSAERLPWSIEQPAESGFGAYSLMAQNSGDGDITCRVTINGAVVAEQTSSGPYSVVTCSRSSGL